MLQEQNTDLVSWWNEQSFAGKELYDLNDAGEIVLRASNLLPERVIATVAAENRDELLKSLLEKFAVMEGRVKELEAAWDTTEEKTKLAEKIAHLKEQLAKAEAIGDLSGPMAMILNWEQTIHNLTQEAYAAKLKIAEEAEKLSESTEWRDTAQAFKDIADKWKASGVLDRGRNDKLWNRIEAARKAFMERKRLHHEDEEKDMLANLDLKIELVEQAESLAASEEWKKTADTYQRLMEEWKKIGPTHHKKNEELWQRFQAAQTVFFDRKREHGSRIQAEHEVNFGLKVAIVERAEALKDSRNWNNATTEYAAMMEEWKKTGRTDKARGDELWQRFMDAQNHFFGAKKAHFKGIKDNFEDNYNRKKALYERAEQIKNSTRFSETTDEMMELLEKWKKIGPIPRSYGDQMWEDFNAARKHFFTRKDEWWQGRKKQVEEEKAYRAAKAKGLVGELEHEIKEEEAKIEDFKNGLQNITPGKKAEELKAHLEKLIVECGERVKHLHKKLEQARKDIATQPGA